VSVDISDDKIGAAHAAFSVSRGIG
jgi:hypothetical protein